MTQSHLAPPEQGITLEGVGFSYPEGPRVFDRLDLHIPSGSTCVFTGNNGCGKSTLLQLCAGLIPPASGTVHIDGVCPSIRHPYELVREGIRSGFVFQDAALLSTMNVLANVALPLQYHADVLGIEPATVEGVARAALRRAGVMERDLFSMPAHLSFGTRRRVALARAIVVEPTHLFVDDPDVGLDPETAGVLHGLLEEVSSDGATTTVIATNRPVFFERLEARRYLLQDGGLRRLGGAGPDAGHRRVA